MKQDVKEMIKYNPPDVPSGTLQINDAKFKFPIQEKSARGLLGHLKIALQKAYNCGYDDCEKGKSEVGDDLSPKPQLSEERIKRVYLEDGAIMIASYSRSINRPQKARFTGNFLSLLVDQINTMLEEAEERGFKQGRAGVDVCPYCHG